MIHTNANRTKSEHRARLSYAEAGERLPREKANKQQRRRTRYNWE